MTVSLAMSRCTGLPCEAPAVNAILPAAALATARCRGLPFDTFGGAASLGTAICIGLSCTVSAARLAGHLLEWRSSGGTALALLGTLGTVDGLRITAAGGWGGVGAATLQVEQDGDGRLWLRYRAPNSATFGESVPLAADGSYDAADGASADAWIRVDYTAARVATTGATVRVADVLNGGLTAGNVAAADAAAGVTTTTQIKLANTGAQSFANLCVWLRGLTRFIALSWDNVTYAAPRSEADGTSLLGAQTIAAGATKTLYVRRTIPAGMAAVPLEPLEIAAAWDDGQGGRAYAAGRDQYRIAGSAAYRVYIKADTPPTPGVDAVAETSATLPWTPTNVFADGVWWLAITYFDGYYESAPVFYRLELASHAQLGNPPSAPDRFWITQDAGGAVTVGALYSPGRDEAANTVADTFALWYTTDGSDPGSGSAADTATATTAGTQALASFDLGAIADGTTLRVLVRMRRGTVDSENDTSEDLLVSIDAPPAAEAAKAERAADALLP